MATQYEHGDKGRGNNRTPLTFKIAFDGSPERQIDVAAYAFDPNGELLASAPVRDGVAQLSLNDRHARSARIFFASIPDDRRKVTLETMSRVQAYEPVFRFDPRQRQIELRPIPEFLWKLWFWCRCRVRGQVVKPVPVGDVTHDKPICYARVHICEVDRLYWLIPRLPDDIIRRIRDEFVAVINHPIPVPEPDPPPFTFDPGVIDPSPINVAKMLRSNLEKRSASTSSQSVTSRFKATSDLHREAAHSLAPSHDDVLLNPQPLPPRSSMDVPAAIRASLVSSSLPTVKQALLDNLTVIRPYFCYWPWLWPYLCRCDEVAVVITDSQGRFDADIWYPCFGDHPDLYFWVEYCIGGVWTTVYHPSVCCNTYWDYTCGSEVTIRVTDPRVPWCGDRPPLPGNQVAILSIGDGVSMTEIQRSSAGADEGLTDAATERPFGGSLEPHVWFGDGLIPLVDGAPTPSGISHYRWSYRRLGSLGDWTPMDHDVVRHYGEIMADTTLTFRPFTLGPDPAFAGQNLFKIRPENPPLNPGAVSSSWAPEVGGRVNTASAYFLSHLLESGDAETAAGKYELKLELFKSDGSLVNLTDEGVLLKVPTVDAPFGLGTVPTQLVAHHPALPGDQEDRVIRDGAGKIVAFRVVLHVDNNVCEAEILDVTVGSNAAGPCGFIQYTLGSKAVVSFVARHPNDFAVFDFDVNKGSCGTVTAASADGPVLGPVEDDFTRDASSLFTKTVDVTDLLSGGSCGTVCVKAAFAETLHVSALATDGFGILTYLDAGASPKAFALEPA